MRVDDGCSEAAIVAARDDNEVHLERGPFFSVVLVGNPNCGWGGPWRVAIPSNERRSLQLNLDDSGLSFKGLGRKPSRVVRV